MYYISFPRSCFTCNTYHYSRSCFACNTYHVRDHDSHVMHIMLYISCNTHQVSIHTHVSVAVFDRAFLFAFRRCSAKPIALTSDTRYTSISHFAYNIRKSSSCDLVFAFRRRTPLCRMVFLCRWGAKMAVFRGTTRRTNPYLRPNGFKTFWLVLQAGASWTLVGKLLKILWNARPLCDCRPGSCMNIF